MKFTNKNVFDASKHVIEPEVCLKERRKNMPPIILDIRSQEDYKVRHLVGAYSFPGEHLKENLSQIPPYAQVMLCGDGDNEKTISFVKLMVDNGFSDVSYVNDGTEKLLAVLNASQDEVILDSLPKTEWAVKIESVLNEKVRPTLAADGGGLSLIKIEEDKVFINYEGSCQGCASAATGTLNFIRNTLSTSLNHEIEVISA
ncbi:MAG: NifU family protein [SAR324 cluster bacterium]|nr:NifU family protein [SAR324 cluster bacterium]